jgi:peroxiredoxin
LIKAKKLTMELLSDPGNQLAGQYGLVYRFSDDLKELYLQFGIDLREYNNDDSWTLPIPGRYIIDQSRTIRYAEVDPDYTIRPEPSHTVEALKKIVG